MTNRSERSTRSTGKTAPASSTARRVALLVAFAFAATVGCSAAADGDGTGPADQSSPVRDVDAPDASDAAARLEWPNADHPATSDPWIALHHDELTKMRPRVLAINLDDDPATRGAFKQKIREVAAGLNEGSRYHGYADPAAPAFLEYEVAKWVDLADDVPPPGWEHKYSSRVPVRCEADPTAWYTADYSAFFSDAFTEAYDVADPDDASRKLGLCDMFERGIVHEVWVYMNGDNDPYTCEDGTKVQPGFAEIVEDKPVYGRDGALTGEFDRCAGNGCLGELDARAFEACGRTVRIMYVNSTRGPGCALHSAGHGYERMARSGAVPELRPRFEPFGNFDLDDRHGLPFSDWYACASANDREGCVAFSGDDSLAWEVRGKRGTIAPYAQGCGNVHFPPNARNHYDYGHSAPVLSTCESYGLGGGADGRDAAEPFTSAKVAGYEATWPDCGGGWQVYWRQSFPGLGNQAKDSNGRPMRNWWPYLYY